MKNLRYMIIGCSLLTSGSTFCEQVILLKDRDGFQVELSPRVIDQSPVLRARRLKVRNNTIELSGVQSEALPTIVCALEVISDIRHDHKGIGKDDLLDFVVTQIEEGNIPVDENNLAAVIRAAQSLQLDILVEALERLHEEGYWKDAEENNGNNLNEGNRLEDFDADEDLEALENYEADLFGSLE